jgi:hypothetical protein
MSDTETLYTLDQLQGAIDRLRDQLAARGWTPFKSFELRSPDEQWTVRTGYASGETYLRINRYSQDRADRHVVSIEPYGPVAYLRLHRRMDTEPSVAIRDTMREAGVPF